MFDIVRQLWPAHAKKVIDAAERVRQNIYLFDLPWDMEQTHVPVKFEGAIDWLACPNGDEEWTFMLARHGQILQLAEAFAITGNRSYAEKAAEILADFTQNAPLTEQTKSTTWRTLDVGIRAANWCAAYPILQQAGVIGSALHKTFFDNLAAHGAYLLAADNTFTRLSNWGVIADAGLYVTGLFLGNEHYASTALMRLERMVALQIMPDGTHWEQSPMYHNEVLAALLLVLAVAKQHEKTVPSAIKEAARAMCKSDIAAQKPDGRQFLQGDSDDTCQKDLLTRGAYLLQDAEIKSAAYETLDFDTLFLCGQAANAEYAALPAAPQLLKSAALRESGNFYLRAGAGEHALCTHFFCAAMGSGHGHAALLHVDVTYGAHDILVDSGRFTYVDGAMRCLLKSAKMHNTIVVDGVDFSPPQDSWAFTHKAQPLATYFYEGNGYSVCEGGHLGYTGLENPVVVQRMVLALAPNLVCICDSAHTNGMHHYARHFHFSNEGNVAQEGESAVYHGGVCAQLCTSGEEKIAITAAPYARHYNALEEKSCVTLSKKCEGFASFFTALYLGDEKDKPVEITRMPVVSARYGTLFSQSEAEAFSIALPGEEVYTVLVRHADCSAGVDIFTVGRLYGYARILVHQKSTDKTVPLAW